MPYRTTTHSNLERRGDLMMENRKPMTETERKDAETMADAIQNYGGNPGRVDRSK